MSVPRNRRLAWLAQEIAKGKSNAMIVLECMTVFPGVSEKTARKDLREILARLTEIELEGLPDIKARFLEIGWKLMEEARSLAQMGPAVNQFKTMAQIAGVIGEKLTEQADNNIVSPESALVRERIKKLMQSKKIKEQAEEAGIDLKTLATDE